MSSSMLSSLLLYIIIVTQKNEPFECFVFSEKYRSLSLSNLKKWRGHFCFKLYRLRNARLQLPSGNMGFLRHDYLAFGASSYDKDQTNETSKEQEHASHPQMTTCPFCLYCRTLNIYLLKLCFLPKKIIITKHSLGIPSSYSQKMLDWCPVTTSAWNGSI